MAISVYVVILHVRPALSTNPVMPWTMNRSRSPLRSLPPGLRTDERPASCLGNHLTVDVIDGPQRALMHRRDQLDRLGGKLGDTLARADEPPRTQVLGVLQHPRQPFAHLRVVDLQHRATHRGVHAFGPRVQHRPLRSRLRGRREAADDRLGFLAELRHIGEPLVRPVLPVVVVEILADSGSDPLQQRRLRVGGRATMSRACSRPAAIARLE